MTEAKQKRFDKLLEDGKTAQEALVQIAVEDAEENSAGEVIANLYAQLQDNGYGPQEAHKLINIKLQNLDQINALMKSVKVGRTLPLDEIPSWSDLNEKQREKLLWDLGFDTKRFKYVIDVGCFRDFRTGRVKCGEFIYSSERLDKAWLNKVIDGCNLASDEARYFFMQSELQVMRGNKKQ